MKKQTIFQIIGLILMLLLFGCENSNDLADNAKFWGNGITRDNFQSFGAKKQQEYRKQYEDAHQKAALIMRTDNSRLARGTSPFSSIPTRHYLDEFKKQGGCSAVRKGGIPFNFGFKNCSSPYGSDENKEHFKTKFKALMEDLKNMARLNTMLLKAHMAEELKIHQNALEEIPVGVAKKLFIDTHNARHFRDKIDSTHIILPPGADVALRKTKAKYKKLQKLISELQTLQRAQGQDRSDNADLGREFLKKRIHRALTEYNEIKLDKDIKQLKKQGFQFSKVDGREVEDVLKDPLKSVDSLVMTPKWLVSEEVTGKKVSAAKLQNQITSLQKTLNTQYQSFEDEIFKQSGHAGVGKGFFSSSSNVLLQKVRIKTGWPFSPEQKFNLVKGIIDAKPMSEKQSVYRELFDRLKRSNIPGGGKASQAARFFDNQQRLKTLTGHEYLQKQFLDKMDDLEKGIKDKDSTFTRWKKELCSGVERTISLGSCDISDIYKSFNAVGKGHDVIKDMAKMLGIDLGGVKNIHGLYASGNFNQYLKDNLANIEQFHRCLMDTFGRSCTGDGYGSYIDPDIDDIRKHKGDPHMYDRRRGLPTKPMVAPAIQDPTSTSR
ncbi:MAG: hypothetical protein ISR65_15560 [Bacteriovoracaceae bacterium]|nr:hypothetical protein [Bacteriovoracaceae bacterium]